MTRTEMLNGTSKNFNHAKKDIEICVFCICIEFRVVFYISCGLIVTCQYSTKVSY